MSDRKNESEEIETAQKNQKKIGVQRMTQKQVVQQKTYAKKQPIWLMKKKIQVNLLYPFIFLNNPRFFLFLYSGACLCYYKA